MRGLPVRRLASPALCAALVLGAAVPTALAVDGDTSRERTHAASRTPVPGADALLTQLDGLGDLGAVLAPVAELLDTALKADGGQLSAAQAQQLSEAVEEAVAQFVPASPATTPAAPVTPTDTTASDAAAPDTAATAPAATATGTAVPNTSDATVTNTSVTTTMGTGVTATDTAVTATGTLPAGTLPTLTRDGDDAKKPTPVADLRADALTDLREALDKLLAAATSGDADQVLPAATAVVTGLVNLLAATLLDGGLPAPDLAGLPKLPTAPVASAQPVTPPQAPTTAAPAS
jgi:hypothetical protein